MQFIRPLSLSVIKFLLQAIENGLVGPLDLAVCLGVSNGGELGLAAQVTEIVGELIGIELPVIIKDDSTGDVEASDDVPPNEPSYFSSGDGSDGFGLYPLGKVVDRYKEILSLHYSLGERAENIHSLRGEW